MRLTLSIPEPLATRFQAAVRPRQRSRLVARPIEQALAERDRTLADACRGANRDRALARGISAWQSFDDGFEE
ncbi:MAG: hypothetical protein HY744_05565 [Deltaproteobacteria bacterium]|nr:hypothetical protein [Deltaproteobacteria bacterium]